MPQNVDIYVHVFILININIQSFIIIVTRLRIPNVCPIQHYSNNKPCIFCCYILLISISREREDLSVTWYCQQHLKMAIFNPHTCINSLLRGRLVHVFFFVQVSKPFTICMIWNILNKQIKGQTFFVSALRSFKLFFSFLKCYHPRRMSFWPVRHICDTLTNSRSLKTLNACNFHETSHGHHLKCW